MATPRYRVLAYRQLIQTKPIYQARNIFYKLNNLSNFTMVVAFVLDLMDFYISGWAMEMMKAVIQIIFLRTRKAFWEKCCVSMCIMEIHIAFRRIILLWTHQTIFMKSGRLVCVIHGAGVLMIPQANLL